VNECPTCGIDLSIPPGEPEPLTAQQRADLEAMEIVRELQETDTVHIQFGFVGKTKPNYYVHHGIEGPNLMTDNLLAALRALLEKVTG
jgi:hypothetical protein